MAEKNEDKRKLKGTWYVAPWSDEEQIAWHTKSFNDFAKQLREAQERKHQEDEEKKAEIRKALEELLNYRGTSGQNVPEVRPKMPEEILNEIEGP